MQPKLFIYFINFLYRWLIDLAEKIKRIEQALFGYSNDGEPERAFLLEYEQALKELLRGNRKPLKELKEKYGDIRRFKHGVNSD